MKNDKKKIIEILDRCYIDPCINLTEEEEKIYKGMPSSEIVADLIINTVKDTRELFNLIRERCPTMLPEDMVEFCEAIKKLR